MHIDIHKEDALTIAKLIGEFNVGDEKLISEQLQPIISEQKTNLAIDLSQLTEINSLGLSELITVVVRSRISQSRVMLVAPSTYIKGVFSVTHLDKWFEVFETMDEARAALA